MTEKVCAVVVTFNRKALLEECLHGVLSQTHSPSQILVVDNASTDGTREMFEGAASSFPKTVRYVRLEINGGGAGGFNQGLHGAMEGECDWFWLMDDDTIPSPTALAELLEAWERFPENRKPQVLASKVEWTDGTLHGMNFPSTRKVTFDPELAVLAAQHGTMWLRSASFVSVLIHRSAVTEHGLPWADYFIWNDDTEYLGRILRRGFGVLVPASVVLHKTSQKHTSLDAAPARSYYQARNVLWMILHSSAWAPAEKWKLAALHLLWIMKYLARWHFRGEALRFIFAGLRDGLLTKPRR